MPKPLTPNQLKWVEALESGEYKQDMRRVGVLSTADAHGNPVAHCCLGVACEVARANGLALDTWTETFSPTEKVVVYDEDEMSFLPSKVQSWLGIDQNNPDIGPYNAATRNDALSQDFKEIAAAIRDYGLS